jgi:protein O-GlcNAc transferase
MSWWRRISNLCGYITTEDIDSAIEMRRWSLALWLSDRYLRKFPGAVPVVLVRAQCYTNLGNKPMAKRQVEAAYALDDSFVPAIFHYAQQQVENGAVEEALRLFALIKDHPFIKDSVDSSLSELCMRRGNAALAREYQLRSWMANFDNLRHANGYLFRLTYSCTDELEIAQEHQFWGETLIPYSGVPKRAYQAALARALKIKNPVVPEVTDKIRIGYWGGDFKEHSVRYFSRSLIEAHNKEKFEIIIYDDNFLEGVPDEHTKAFRTATPFFMVTSAMDDDAIAALIESHRLDILVDIQGHTSANRLHMLQHRFATLQITALAYPPTTGLSTIDYKVVDSCMVTSDSYRYYTERQLVLPNSFWCFDPKSDAPYKELPPYVERGYITFGCFGNAAKITPSVLGAWAQILRKVENARLLIVSPSFNDDTTLKVFVAGLDKAGIVNARVDCRPGVSTEKLWYVYQEVDVILDTFPFNGGTTSSWATYAGVPVLTLAGKSLVSSMGKSIMTNLGFPEFVVNDLSEYVAKAVALTATPRPIANFRKNARERYASRTLGNGAMYANEFESKCLELLEERRHGRTPGTPPEVPPLPLPEMLRRARMVWYHGNVEACNRILNVCRKHYGETTEISELEAEKLLQLGQFNELKKLFLGITQLSPSLLHTRILLCIAQSSNDDAKRYVAMMLEKPIPNAAPDFLQQELWAAWAGERDFQGADFGQSARNNSQKVQQPVLVFFVGGDVSLMESRRDEFLQRYSKSGAWEIKTQILAESERVDAMNDLLLECDSDPVVLVLRESVQLLHPHALEEISHTLRTCALVGAAGAMRWRQKDWSQELPQYKAWGLLRKSRISDAHLDLHFAGADQRKVVTDAVVLDGKFLAFKPKRIGKILWDEEMADAEHWAEEDWCNRVQEAGGPLHIHRGLGLLVDGNPRLVGLKTSQGQVAVTRRFGFDPMDLPIADYSVQTVMVRDEVQAMAVMEGYLR